MRPWRPVALPSCRSRLCRVRPQRGLHPSCTPGAWQPGQFHLYVGNFAVYTLAPADISVAIGLLHHLDDELALETPKAIAAALKPGGRLITVDPCFHSDQSTLQRLVVSNDRGMHVRQFERYAELARPIFPQPTADFWHGHFPFPHSICVMQTRKASPRRIASL